jgi:hypothetical protein
MYSLSGFLTINQPIFFGVLGRGIMPEAYMDNAMNASYTQMLGDCPEYITNGLTCDVMGYI